jgi:hypothetical protein
VRCILTKSGKAANFHASRCGRIISCNRDLFLNFLGIRGGKLLSDVGPKVLSVVLLCINSGEAGELEALVSLHRKMLFSCQRCFLLRSFCTASKEQGEAKRNPKLSLREVTA